MTSEACKTGITSECNSVHVMCMYVCQKKSPSNMTEVFCFWFRYHTCATRPRDSSSKVIPSPPNLTLDIASVGFFPGTVLAPSSLSTRCNVLVKSPSLPPIKGMSGPWSHTMGHDWSIGPGGQGHHQESPMRTFCWGFVWPSNERDKNTRRQTVHVPSLTSLLLCLVILQT